MAQRILDAGGKVLELGPKRTSLEQFFVERVTAAAAGIDGPTPSPERARSTATTKQPAANPMSEVPR